MLCCPKAHPITEQMETDLEATEATVKEANTGVATLKDELAKLDDQLVKKKASVMKRISLFETGNLSLH
jgi:uncharacterized small protein (DUF1192 family)